MRTPKQQAHAKAHGARQTMFAQPAKVEAPSSWWATPRPREGFTAVAQQEVPRMAQSVEGRSSRIGMGIENV